jgi:hypothetical protein
MIQAVSQDHTSEKEAYPRVKSPKWAETWTITCHIRLNQCIIAEGAMLECTAILPIVRRLNIEDPQDHNPFRNTSFMSLVLSEYCFMTSPRWFLPSLYRRITWEDLQWNELVCT